jgi:E3 ubiquitin-protein ligase RAD18
MKEAQVFAHLDKCETEKQDRQQRKGKTSQSHLDGFGTTPSQPQTRPQDRINQLNYSMLTDSALAKKLKQGGVPNWGAKQLMTNRHREWVNIWNANCDSTQPRTTRDLLRELDVWERTQGGRAPTANSSLMRKDFDGDAHSKLHCEDFSRLIADARRKKNVPAPDAGGSKEREKVGEALGEEEERNRGQISQPEAGVSLPTRDRDDASPYGDDPPPSSQREPSTARALESDMHNATGSQASRRPLTSSQEFARQNHLHPPPTEQMVGR